MAVSETRYFIQVPEPKNLATDTILAVTTEPPTPTTVINGFILPQTSRNFAQLSSNEVVRNGGEGNQLPTTVLDVGVTENEINVDTTEKQV